MTSNSPKKIRAPNDFRPDAGLSFVELIVVLGILAGVTAMVASSIGMPVETGPTAFEKIASFVETARLEAMRSGQAGLLVLLPTALKAGDRQLGWSADAGFVSVGDDRIEGAYSAIIYADGTLSGAPLSFQEPGRSHSIAVVTRPRVSTGSAE